MKMMNGKKKMEEEIDEIMKGKVCYLENGLLD